MQVVVGVWLLFFLWWVFLMGFAWVFRLKTSFKSVGVDEIPAPRPPLFPGEVDEFIEYGSMR